MYSVTGRIQNVKQPRGGYVKPSAFDHVERNDEKKLNIEENLHPTLIGMVVDYLTRFMSGASANDAFHISLQGAKLAECMGKRGSKKEADKYLKKICGLDDTSIIYGCKMVTFDVWYRNPLCASRSKDAKNVCPNEKTIENIRIMVNRSLSFFKDYGPVTVDGFNFLPNGYSSVVSSGDGDFLTYDTLWDFKVSKAKPTSKHTLQLLMYWIMGQHSGNEMFKEITKLGIFNPRLNVVYTYDISHISKETIKEIEEKVICYS